MRPRDDLGDDRPSWRLDTGRSNERRSRRNVVLGYHFGCVPRYEDDDARLSALLSSARPPHTPPRNNIQHPAFNHLTPPGKV